MRTETKRQEDLKAGDILHLIWCGDKIIVGFEEYKGPLEFVGRIAICAGGFRMSLEKNRPYTIVKEYSCDDRNSVRIQEEANA